MHLPPSLTPITLVSVRSLMQVSSQRSRGDMSGPQTNYLHGTSVREQARLSKLNLSLNGLSLRELELTAGTRVIDFGCGLGQLTRDIARAVMPGGTVVAFDVSSDQLTRARALAEEAGEEDLVEYRQVDVGKPPYAAGERGTFDLAHARFMVEHVRDPLELVREMVSAVRPGGRIVIEDNDHDALRFWPEPWGFGQLWSSYILVIARNQNDPFVGRRIPALLRSAGATPSRLSGIFYGGAGNTPTMAAAVENVIGLFEGV